MYKIVLFFTIIIFTNFTITVNANPQASTDLEIAIINNNYQMAQKAFNDGADLNDLRFTPYNNPLKLAIDRNSITMVNLLIQKGADVNAYISNNLNQTTPLIEAIKQQNIPIVTMLLNAKANVNQPSRETIMASNIDYIRQNSPLMVAIMTAPYSYAIFELLLSKGADVNYTNHNGYSVLMATTTSNKTIYQQELSLTMARALLKKGANPNLRDNTGKTALTYAQNNSFLKMVELLSPITTK